MTRAALAVAVTLTLVGAARAAHARGCHEVSFVVGHERCTRFGTWSREQPGPALWVDLGVARHRFTSEPFVLGSGTLAAAGAPTDLATVAFDPMSMRVLLGIDGLFYAGVETDGGWLTTPPRGAGTPAQTGGVFAGHFVTGAHAALWRASVGAELAAGGRLVDILGDCPDKTCPAAQAAFQTRRELEARATLDLWVTPHVSLGVGYGRSLLDAGDSRWLFYLGGHTRALDGMR